MKFLAGCIILLGWTSALAQEDLFKPENASSPEGHFYGSVIPIHDSDPPNGNPYRIAVRDASTGMVIGSEISRIDMTSKESLAETRVTWTETGRFVIFTMVSDRRTRVARVFYVDSEKRTARSVELPDYFQNMLGRIGKVEPPEFYSESVQPLGNDSIAITVSAGDRDAKYSVEGTAVVELVADADSDLCSRLRSVSVK